MKAITKFLAGGVAIAALASAAPAAAQYYPGYGSPYGYGSGNVVGQVINQVLGGGYGGYGYNGYGAGNSQAAVSQCVGAVQARLAAATATTATTRLWLQRQRYGNARVLGISRVEQRSNGGLTVRGVANSGRYAGRLWLQRPEPGRPDVQVQDRLSRLCHRRRRRSGAVELRLQLPPYSNYGTDYSQYGYRRY